MKEAFGLILWLFLAFLGGVLTILSPCILPVLPFVFARSDQPFRRSGLPLLAGMAATFTLVASLAAVGGAWAVRANQFGRIGALILFGVFGLTLLSDSLAERLARPFVRLGGRLSGSHDAKPGLLRSFLLGVATGLLWTPCAGPILGLILTGAALSGASARTALLLAVYAAGAATSLALALVAGGRVFKAMKRSLGAEAWIRRILGVAVLAGVAAVAFGLDRGVLTRLSLAGPSNLEQRLVSLAGKKNAEPVRVADETITVSGGDAAGGPGALGDLAGATAWINSPPLTAEALRGKVVLVDFWTYSCINCLRTLPAVKSWYAKYKDSGLVVIGVHAPEFPFEKDEANVRRAVRELGIDYPVAMDNDYAIWRAFNNEYWPAHYFIDATGRVRYHHFGEGEYEQSEKWIRELLEERNHQAPPDLAAKIAAGGAEAASDPDAVESPETYIGYDRADNFRSPGGFKKDDAQVYRAPARLKLNDWALTGQWKDEEQIATLLASGGGIVYRFHARDLHLVLGPGSEGAAVRFRVTLDGKPPGADHGEDCDENGDGVVTESRLYQLIRQKGAVRDREFHIEFLTPGARAFAFTFG
ncbi:MAG: cytochrome c biogenesis protein DipZ [Terracidiphilus sp.]|jgi:cytochrome c biogenesis protein CcdA/thiol-disulfide isomerase/thioredoxin